MKFSNIYIYETKKFKNITLFLTIKLPFSKEKAAARSILPILITKQSMLYSNIEDLYGAKLDYMTFKANKLHTINFRIVVPDNRFIQGDIINDLIKELNNKIIDLFIKSKLSHKDLKLAKQDLLNETEKIHNNNLINSLFKVYKHMYSDEEYSHPVLGTSKQVENLDIVNVKEAHDEIINTKDLNLYLVGNINKSKILNKYTYSNHKSSNNYSIYTRKKNTNSIKIINEKSSLAEGLLILGYQTFSSNSRELIINLLIDTLLAKSSSSILFHKLREINKDVYYIDSKFDGDKGGIFIISAVGKEKYKKISEDIQYEVNKLKEGEIQQNQLTIAKKIIISTLLESEDSPLGIIDRYIQHSKNGIPVNSSEQIKIINKVTVDDVISQIKKWQLNIIYFSGV
ncbi:insulinase family protein [Staphylococcus cohnii]|nr:insulinase family protein [Staphylococcus cohnii]